MSYSMIWRLILKDWYLQRWTLALAIVGAPVSLGVIALGGRMGFTLGIILIVTLLVAIGSQLIIASMVNERQEQTLAFVMTLPVSTWEYSVAKLTGSLLIFLVPWGTSYFGSLALLWLSPNHIRGLIPFATIMGLEILVSTSLMAAVALTTESQRWTVGVMIAGNLALNAIGYWVAHIGSIAQGMEGSSVAWTGTATTLFLAEFLLIALILATALFIQSRKRDFL